VSLLKLYSKALELLAGRKPMWEPDPVWCCAVDCTVNTEKEEVILVSSSFFHLLAAIFGLFYATGCAVVNRKSFHSSFIVLTCQCRVRCSGGSQFCGKKV